MKGEHSMDNRVLVSPLLHEFIRMIDAYSHVQKNGEVCPANWEDGKEALTANREGIANYLTNN